MHKNVPYYVKNLPRILLVICALHLVVKSCLLKHQLPSVLFNETNTHFGLTCVTIAFLCVLFSLVIVDILFKSHFTFRYVIGMNIAVVACGLFVTGYLLGHIVEIWFARLTWYACRQLGLNTRSNGTMPIEDITSYEEARCDEAVSLAFHDISIDLLIHIFFLPLHVFATAFSWTFSGLFRPRGHEDYE